MTQRDLFSGIGYETKANGALDMAKIKKPMNPLYQSTLEDVYARAEEAAKEIQSYRPDIKHEIIKGDEARLRQYVASLEKHGGVVGFDSEASGVNPRTAVLAGFSIYAPYETAAYIPTGHDFYEHNFSQATMLWFIDEIHRLASENKIYLTMQNASYDTQLVASYSDVWLFPHLDTLTASNLLNENEPHGLKHLWSKYIVKGQFKGSTFSDLFENRKFNSFDPDKVYIYATLDAVMQYEVAMFHLAMLQKGSPYNKKLGLEKVSDLLWNLEMVINEITAGMEYEGIRFDMDLNLKLQKDYEARIKIEDKAFQARVRSLYKERESTLSPSIRQAFVLPMNINSPVQMNMFLYDVMGFDLDESTRRQVLRNKQKNSKRQLDPEVDWRSAGKVAMGYLKKTYTDHMELFKEYENYKSTIKIYTSFIIGLREHYNPRTGRVHGGWNPMGTVTGRMSSSSPNLQNIPSHNGDIRPMFLPDEGYKFIACDYPQQEPRYLAYESQDPILINTFKERRDIYSVLISLATGRSYEECTKDFHGKEYSKWLEIYTPLEKRLESATQEEMEDLIKEIDKAKALEPINWRNRGKTLLLSVMYGLGADSLSFSLGIPLEEAEGLLERLHAELEGVKEYEKTLKAEARKNGYIELVGGRKRRFPDYALPPFTVKNPAGGPVLKSTTAQIDKKLKGVWKFHEREDILQEMSVKLGVDIVDNSKLRSEDETRILNSKIQGGAAYMTKLALYLLWTHPKMIEHNGHRRDHGIKLQVHDEIIIQYPEHLTDEGSEILVWAMTKAAYAVVKGVEFIVEAEVTDKWVKGD